MFIKYIISFLKISISYRSCNRSATWPMHARVYFCRHHLANILFFFFSSFQVGSYSMYRSTNKAICPNNDIGSLLLQFEFLMPILTIHHFVCYVFFFISSVFTSRRWIELLMVMDSKRFVMLIFPFCYFSFVSFLLALLFSNGVKFVLHSISQWVGVGIIFHDWDFNSIYTSKW